MDHHSIAARGISAHAINGMNAEEFPSDEMRTRLSRIRKGMREHGLDALISTDPASIRYATGFRGEPGTLYVSADEVVLFTSFRTRPWAESQTQGIGISPEANPVDEIARRLDRGRGKTVGVDSGISHDAMLRISALLDAGNVCLSPVIGRARAIKSDAEIARLRESQRINEEVFAEWLTRLRPGMSEKEAQGCIISAIAARPELDGPSFDPIIAAGANAWEIHHRPDDTALRDGDLLVVDLGVRFRGYASDMTRSVCLGKATGRMREVHAMVVEAQRLAIEALRTGVAANEVDRAARDRIAASGHGRSYTHGLGHSIGLETHDPGFNLNAAADFPIEPGMVFTIEPGAYLEGEFGVRIEDTVVVGADGNERLTRLPTDLIEL